jgi:hypothetical protein
MTVRFIAIYFVLAAILVAFFYTFESSFISRAQGHAPPGYERDPEFVSFIWWFFYFGGSFALLTVVMFFSWLRARGKKQISN